MEITKRDLREFVTVDTEHFIGSNFECVGVEVKNKWVDGKVTNDVEKYIYKIVALDKRKANIDVSIAAGAGNVFKGKTEVDFDKGIPVGFTNLRSSIYGSVKEGKTFVNYYLAFWADGIKEIGKSK